MNKLMWALCLLCIGLVFNSCEKDDPTPSSNSPVIGCMDADATNFNSDATEACTDDCCEYDDDQTCSMCGNDPCTCSADNDCLLIGTWAVSHAIDDYGYCAWYCGDDYAPSMCEPYDDDYDFFCLGVQFWANGNIELGVSNGDYEEIESGTWSGGCDAGDVITTTIEDEYGDLEVEGFGIITEISSDEMLLYDEDDEMTYYLIRVE